MALHPRHVLVGEVPDRQFGGHAFEGRAHVENLDDLLARLANDEHALARLDAQKAFGDQPANGIPQRAFG